LKEGRKDIEGRKKGHRRKAGRKDIERRKEERT
jgi:hypothetical protein